jgi:hypothetical protein
METAISAVCVKGLLCKIEKVRKAGFKVCKYHEILIISCSQNFGQSLIELPINAV